jgi:hypothetical protein
VKDAADMFAPRARGRCGDNEAQHRPGRGPKVTGAAGLVDLTLRLVRERPLSIAVTDPAQPGGKWIFLPKSQIEYADKGAGVVEVTLPGWLARDKGLI